MRITDIELSRRRENAAAVTDTEFGNQSANSIAVTNGEASARTQEPESFADILAWHRDFSEKQREHQREQRRLRLLCRHCGKRKGCKRAHYERSPKCWEAEQAGRRASYEAGSRSYDCCHKAQCRFCRRAIYSRNGSRVCPYCAQQRKADRQRARRAAAKVQSATCPICGKSFESKRSDAKTCSGKCRQQMYRLNKRKT